MMYDAEGLGIGEGGVGGGSRAEREGRGGRGEERLEARTNAGASWDQSAAQHEQYHICYV